jgi:translation initiation factor IF-1
MAKEELLEFDGVVTEVLPDGNFRVMLDNPKFCRMAIFA